MTLSWGGKGGLFKAPINTKEGQVKKSGRKIAVPEDSEEEGEGIGNNDEADDPSPENADAIVEEGVRV